MKKNFENRLVFGEIIKRTKMVPFFAHPVNLARRRLQISELTANLSIAQPLSAGGSLSKIAYSGPILSESAQRRCFVDQ